MHPLAIDEEFDLSLDPEYEFNGKTLWVDAKFHILYGGACWEDADWEIEWVIINSVYDGENEINLSAEDEIALTRIMVESTKKIERYVESEIMDREG